MVDPRAFTLADSVALDREIVRREGCWGFVRLAWPYLEPKEPDFVPTRVLREMCKHAEAMITPDRNVAPLIQELVINIPPGFTKSKFWTVLFPAYVWTRHPEKRFIFACYDLGLSLAHAEMHFKLCQTSWYRQRWGQTVTAKGPWAMGDFGTVAGGFRFSTSVGGKGTGRHADYFGIDDPVKPSAAQRSGKDLAAEVTNANEWLKNTVPSRTLNVRSYVKFCVMQRIHEEDPSTQLLREGYNHLRLPMKFEARDACRTPVGGDWRTLEGELLDPLRFPLEAVEKQARAMGGWEGYVCNAQLQQRPSPPGGMIFREENFGSFSAAEMPLRYMMHSVISVDSKFKKSDTTSDVGITVWGVKDGYLYCYDAISENMGFIETMQALDALVKCWKVNAVLIEDKANGSSIIEVLRKKWPHVLAIDPKTSKEERAHAFNVSYVAKAVKHNQLMLGLEGFEAALKGFPRATKKDVVDSSTMAGLYLIEKAAKGGALLKALDGLVAQGPAVESALGGFDSHFIIR